MLETARELGVPLRHFTPGIHHCGNFYGQTAYGDPLPDALTVEALIGILEALPPGITELGCHPAGGDDFEAMYCCERAQEVRVLCDPRVRTAIADMRIVLCSFGKGDTRREGQLPTLLDAHHE
jgi:predicted glycoside hydrolase/deacetylase ChbG (UPF0249 family)